MKTYGITRYNYSGFNSSFFSITIPKGTFVEIIGPLKAMTLDGIKLRVSTVLPFITPIEPSELLWLVLDIQVEDTPQNVTTGLLGSLRGKP